HHFLQCSVAHRDLHSFPTRRSSDLDKNLRTKDIDQAAQSDGNIPEMPVEGFHCFDFTIEVFFKQILTVVGGIFLVFQVFIVGDQRRGRAVYLEASATSTRTRQTIPFDHHMPQLTTAVPEPIIEFSINQQTISNAGSHRNKYSVGQSPGSTEVIFPHSHTDRIVHGNAGQLKSFLQEWSQFQRHYTRQISCSFCDYAVFHYPRESDRNSRNF